MKYKVIYTKRNRVYTEVDADSKENAYWKATSVTNEGTMGKDYNMTILGPTNVKIKKLK
jgi:hypothetical protein